MSMTGFYRVLVTKRNKNTYFKYQIRNKLIQKEIIRKDIFDLKQEVERLGFLWGIIDKEKAQKYKGKYNLKVLQGRYGIKEE